MSQINRIKLNIAEESRYIQLPFPTAKNVMIFMSLAASGDMGINSEPPNSDRVNFLAETGSKQTFVLEQIHSRTIYDISTLGSGMKQGDGLVSSMNTDVSLAVSVADCVPIFLFDPINCCMGAFHSGWKGTGIITDGLALLKKNFGSRAENMEAVIGPSIGSCCYKVDQERYDYFLNNFGNAGLEKRETELFINLKEVNANLLAKSGVGKINLYDICTCCNKNFFSYRRQGASHFSRMLAYIRFLG